MKKYNKIGILAIVALAITGTTVFATTGKVYNTSKGLVLRGAASKSGEPLATVAEGAEVEILENNGEWYKVNANGQEGYLFAEYVKVEEEATENTVENENTETNTSNVETKIHVLPLITSTTLGVVPAEGEMSIEKTVGNWNYITYENVKGWVRTNNNTKVETELEEEVPVKQEENKTTEEQETETQEQETQNQITPTAPQEDTNVSFRKGYINSSAGVNVRKEPSTSAEVVTTLNLNTGVTITAQTDEWYKIIYGDYMGYIYKPLISETPIETPTTTSRSGETRSVTTEETIATVQTETPVQQEKIQEETTIAPVTTSSDAGEKIVSFAKQYLGYSYVYGGTTPSGGFDCSGFVYYVFNSCGYSISRSCSAQAQTGTAVSKSELQLGDIVFFNNTSNGSIGHVGIYIGDGRFIHAANPTRGVVTDTINSGYYNTYYYSARRVAN